MPLALGRPVWVDDPHFNLGYHLRRTGLPAPGGDEELRLLVGRVMSQQLDRTKPLWEIWMIEGLSEGRWALLTKVHHCMVDGVSGAELLSAMLDDEREPRPPSRPTTGGPERQPPGAELAARALARARAQPLRRRALGAALAPPAAEAGVRHAARAAHLERRAAGPRRLVAERPDRPTPALGLGRSRALGREAGPCGPRRHGQRRGAHRDRGRLPRASRVARRVRPTGSCAPWSRCRCAPPEEHGAYNNRVSAIFADLPVGIEDPVERLAAVHTRWST